MWPCSRATIAPALATCYRHQVFETTKAFVRATGLQPGHYTIAFQSRLGLDAWLTPATEEELIRLARKGVRKVSVLCPSFVTDCLETLEEIAERGREVFLENGGSVFRLIPCLNDHAQWVEALASLVARTAGAQA